MLPPPGSLDLGVYRKGHVHCIGHENSLNRQHCTRMQPAVLPVAFRWPNGTADTAPNGTAKFKYRFEFKHGIFGFAGAVGPRLTIHSQFRPRRRRHQLKYEIINSPWLFPMRQSGPAWRLVTMRSSGEAIRRSLGKHDCAKLFSQMCGLPCRGI
ncbi:hypothetical protein CALCODRAFT_493025 [Calocera cornea HHB12733]|uniref:Uncharacterized protein n=1 Tax=Calocera cornea HHB12733 TaxID=1353952 RepID=A0A165I213_9BASI|nr:hypothetical protein CALCODRAFT_493025 [Calocera cornea HHB12733]